MPTMRLQEAACGDLRPRAVQPVTEWSTMTDAFTIFLLLQTSVLSTAFLQKTR